MCAGVGKCYWLVYLNTESLQRYEKGATSTTKEFNDKMNPYLIAEEWVREKFGISR